MNYLIFETKDLARNRSKEIAQSLGCGQDENDTTIGWFGSFEHPVTKEGALEIILGEEYRLTEEEISQLKDRIFMIEQNWFPNEDDI